MEKLSSRHGAVVFFGVFIQYFLLKINCKISFNYNPGHNILRHFDVWQNFRVTTSETNGDY